MKSHGPCRTASADLGTLLRGHHARARRGVASGARPGDRIGKPIGDRIGSWAARGPGPLGLLALAASCLGVWSCDRGLPAGGVAVEAAGGGTQVGDSPGGDGQVDPQCGQGGADGVGVGGAGGADPDTFVETVHAFEGRTHVPPCSDVVYCSEPPSSGNHYAVWAEYKTYDAPVPWGFLVHDLEHGGIDVVYNCPVGCPDEVAAAQAWIDSLPDDALCGGRPRIVLAPDPTLTCRWAASAWQWTLRGGTFSVDPFQQFYERHYESPDPSLQAPEETLCGGGIDEPAGGWCP